ncbi:hypothetical protein PHYPSEUDO_007964 [Phytophthora pseudosyringae]|uniref:Polycystin cation channel PKD1/PKD2 domain-containing protein n=1 Tax=Phytophthora pseudosyringae TaxID=221518 RepID=A0A8T1WB15_9STRA|nr:hypothetical protein PHYPSEUDO_007964 [Phytophthora pseudosyringae]
MTLETYVFAAALGALVPSFLLLLQLERQWARELPPQCSGVLDSVLWLQPDAVFPHLACLGASGRALYVDFYAFDLLLFPLIYSAALLGLLRRLWPARRLVWALPVLAATCDVAENVSVLQLLRRFPERWGALETVVSVLTRTNQSHRSSLPWAVRAIFGTGRHDHQLGRNSWGLSLSVPPPLVTSSYSLENLRRSKGMKKLVPGSTTPSAARDGGLHAKMDASAVPVQAAYDSLCHDREIVKAVWRIPVPVLYFCAFVSMLFAHIPATSMYEQGFAVSSALATSGSDTVTTDSTIKFDNIGQLSDVFEWLTDSFAPAVFITEDYNGNVLARDRWGRVATFNKVLGAVNFQVTRKAMHACVTQPFLANLYPNCYDESDTTTEQRLISFDSNATDAAGKIAALKAKGDWLDFSTDELLITVVTYNGELQGYAVTEMQLTFLEGGSVQTSSSTTPALSNPYSASATIAADLVVLIFFLLALATQLRRLYRYRRTGVRNVVCGDVWVVIEHASTVVVVVFYVVWFSIVLLMFQKKFRDNLASLVVGGKNWASDAEARAHLYAVIDMLKSVAKLTVALRLIATLAVFLLSLRILKRFRFHPRLSILTRTVASALHQFGAFFVVFIVIFVTFAVSGTVLFGDRVAEFSSLQVAMETCINMLFGNFDYASIQGLYAPVCMLYYWSYMIVVSLVLLNMMLAIVLDAYAEVSSESYKSHNNLAVTRIADNMTWSLLLWLNDFVRCRSRGNKRDVSAKTAPRSDETSTSPPQPSFGGLGRADVVFRGRIRPLLLERGLRALLEQKEATQGAKSTQPKMLTPRMLMEMFPSASIQEGEARAAVQDLVGGLASPGSTEGQMGERVGSNLSDDESEPSVHPAESVTREGPSTTDATSPSTQASNTAASADLQRMAAQLAALEQKLDLLLQHELRR